MAKQSKVQLVIDGKDNTSKALASVEKNLASLEKRAVAAGRTLGGMIAGAASLQSLKTIGAINSEWLDMSSRLRRVTADEGEFLGVTERLGQVADATWTGMNETVESFLSMQGPLADMGYTMDEQVDFVAALNNALVVSGAKKEVAASVQNALNKAMAGGVLRGENLNTVIEKGGYIAELLAKELGVNVSELRALGAQGKITGEVMYNALGGNFKMIAKEAEAMPGTFDDAMGRVHEAIVGAFRDKELMEPVTDSLLELSKTLRDPAIQEGLGTLAAALVKLAEWGAKAGVAFVDLGKGIAYMAASITGNVSEMDKLDKELASVQKRIEGGIDISGWDLVPFIGVWNNTIGKESKEALEKQKASLEAQREAILDQQTGMTKDQRDAAEERKRVADKEVSDQRAAHRKHISDLEKFRQNAVKEAEKRGKELAKAEKDAVKKVEDARKEGARIEKTFDDIRKSLSAGPDKEPRYADYQKLATSARQALAAGDTEKAKEDAKAAAEVLVKLRESGANTFGFEGMTKQMQGIAQAAADIEKADAEAELEAIRAEMEQLKAQAAELQDMPVSLELDEEALATVKGKINSLLEGLKSDAVIPVRVETTETKQPEGYATGGLIRGKGTGTSDSILARLSNGEYVIKAAAVRKYGEGMLNSINGLSLPKFADGGLVGALDSPAPASLGTLNFNLPGGESFSTQATADSLADIRRLALKYGKPGR